MATKTFASRVFPMALKLFSQSMASIFAVFRAAFEWNHDDPQAP
jgi:hypothetical protein